MADLHQLLLKTSRTFGLSIPLLPNPTRSEMTLAYLLFRIADTFEDAVGWSTSRQVEALKDFAELLISRDRVEAQHLASQWLDQPPTMHQGYLELLEATPAVIEALDELDPAAAEILVRHTRRTASGMTEFVNSSSSTGELRLENMAALRRYCYVVAGIVGEMLSDLFVLRCAALADYHAELMRGSELFGEGLQLVNILKDSNTDASEGRVFIPPAVNRGAILEVAHRGLEGGARYILLLDRCLAPRGFATFLTLPLLLAWGTLDGYVREGAGFKLSRPRVASLSAAVEQLMSGPPGSLSYSQFRAAYADSSQPETT